MRSWSCLVRCSFFGIFCVPTRIALGTQQHSKQAQLELRFVAPHRRGASRRRWVWVSYGP